MEELVKLVPQKVGLSEDMAKTAVNTVIGFLKDKLPGGLDNQLDCFLSGIGDTSNILENSAKCMGDMFGKN